MPKCTRRWSESGAGVTSRRWILSSYVLISSRNIFLDSMTSGFYLLDPDAIVKYLVMVVCSPRISAQWNHGMTGSGNSSYVAPPFRITCREIKSIRKEDVLYQSTQSPLSCLFIISRRS